MIFTVPQLREFRMESMYQTSVVGLLKVAVLLFTRTATDNKKRVKICNHEAAQWNDQSGIAHLERCGTSAASVARILPHFDDPANSKQLGSLISFYHVVFG